MGQIQNRPLAVHRSICVIDGGDVLPAQHVGRKNQFKDVNKMRYFEECVCPGRQAVPFILDNSNFREQAAAPNYCLGS